MKDIMAGIDLHSNNLMLALVAQNGQRLMHKKLPCQLPQIEDALRPYKERIDTIAVESTFNWYWLVDRLQFSGYPVVLANPAAMRQYEGIKHTDDKHDAFWLAEMLRLKILPTGYICEGTLRPVRDLLRRRLGLVRKRTALILSLKSLHARMHGSTLPLGQIKQMSVDEVWRLFDNSSDQLLAREELRLIQELKVSIERLEDQVHKRANSMPEYKRLLTIPGIGPILGMTIALETGPVERFPTPGNFASYCRSVRSERTSNGKKKGENNVKCGNKYLGWAFVEAANFAQRFDPLAKAFYERKKAQVNVMVATKALACKLAKAAWHVMSQNVEYDPNRIFGGAKKNPTPILTPPQEPTCATDHRTVSFTLKTAVERGDQKKAGEKITSPVESSQLAGQSMLGLRSRRALSSAGKSQDSSFGPGRKEKSKQQRQNK
jgi:transposase